jgi:hypothetical protein
VVDRFAARRLVQQHLEPDKHGLERVEVEHPLVLRPFPAGCALRQRRRDPRSRRTGSVMPRHPELSVPDSQRVRISALSSATGSRRKASQPSSCQGWFRYTDGGQRARSRRSGAPRRRAVLALEERAHGRG